MSKFSHGNNDSFTKNSRDGNKLDSGSLKPWIPRVMIWLLHACLPQRQLVSSKSALVADGSRLTLQRIHAKQQRIMLNSKD